MLRYHAALLRRRADDRGLLQFPLTHIGGIVMFVMLPIAHGSSMVFMEAFDPELAIDLIERHGVTSAGGPPAILQAHVRGAELLAARRCAPCARSGSGAADVSPELMREPRETLRRASSTAPTA